MRAAVSRHLCPSVLDVKIDTERRSRYHAVYHEWNTKCGIDSIALDGNPPSDTYWIYLSPMLHWNRAIDLYSSLPGDFKQALLIVRTEITACHTHQTVTFEWLAISFLSLGFLICHSFSVDHLAQTSLTSRPPSVFIYTLTYYWETALHREVINFWLMICPLLDNSNYILMSEKLSVKWFRCSWIGAK